MSVLPDRRVVLFGGMDKNGAALGDTWAWDLATEAGPRASSFGAGMASLMPYGFVSLSLPSNSNPHSPLGGGLDTHTTPRQPGGSPGT